MLKKIATNFRAIPTPFYYYDLQLLQQTLQTAKAEAERHGYHLHYALKANYNQPVLSEISKLGFGADCVSGPEVKRALETGFSASDIVFAGVGKTDAEIEFALENNIFCFNCESVQELEVINELAINKKKVAQVALRLNPNVNANTHHYITTGLEENKFGLNISELNTVLEVVKQCECIKLIGIHFHIGSQITDLIPFQELCERINDIQLLFKQKQIQLSVINVGGGLGVNYLEPDNESIPDFKSYFEVFAKHLTLEKGQEVHFELGRALVAQCGTLISRVLYTKSGQQTNFLILDAGMTELIRPALYQAFHKIENLNGGQSVQKYDVVGPICESSDCFGKGVELPVAKRGDLIAVRTAGAYGEVMASNYNLRTKVIAYYSTKDQTMPMPL